MSDKFCTEFQIYTYQSDPQEYVRPSALFGFFIEAASMHAERLGVGHTELRQKHNAFWALSRFHIDIVNTPKWHNTINITTWPSGYNRLFAHRYFVFSDCSGSKLAQGVSDWVIMDYGNRSLCNVESILKDVPGFNLEEEHLGVNNVKIQAAKAELSTQCEMRSMYSHLDMNGHVNSVHYLDWSVDCIGGDYLKNHLVTSADINFQHEIPVNNIIRLLCQNNGNDTFVVTGLLGDKVSFSSKLRFENLF